MKTIGKVVQVTFAVVMIALAVKIFWGKLGGESVEFEDGKAKLTRWRSEADAAARSVCSNELGFYRVVELRTETQTANPSSWTANATVEVITGAAGVSRRQIQMRGHVAYGSLYFNK